MCLVSKKKKVHEVFLLINMEHDLTERKRKKKYKKHSGKAKRRKREKFVPDDDDASSEGELQWVESTGPALVQSHVPKPRLKHDDWMTAPLSSGSLTELAHRKTIENDRNDDIEVLNGKYCEFS